MIDSDVAFSDVDRQLKIRIVSSVILVGFCVSMIYFFIINGYFLHLNHPRATIFCCGADPFADFLGMYSMTKDWRPFATTFRGMHVSYPPFAYLLLLPFASISSYDWACGLYFSVVLLGFLAFMRWGAWIDEKSLYVKFMTLMPIFLLSYPLIFAMERLNTESLLFLLVAGFYWAFETGRFRLGAVLLAAATAAKAYPALFALLLLWKKKYRELGLYCLMVLAWTALSMVFFRVGTHALKEAYQAAAPGNTVFMFSQTLTIMHSVSFFSVWRIIQYYVTGENGLEVGLAMYRYYWPLCALIGGLIVRAVLFRETAFWEKVTIIAAAIIVLPPTSADYKLLYIFVALIAFFNARTNRRDTYLYSVLFSVLLVTTGYAVLYLDVNTQVIIDPLILLFMVLHLSLRRPRAPIT